MIFLEIGYMLKKYNNSSYWFTKLYTPVVPTLLLSEIRNSR